MLPRVAARVEELSLDLLSASIREERVLKGFDPDIIVLEMQGKIENLLPKPSILRQLQENKKLASESPLNEVKKNKNIELKF